MSPQALFAVIVISLSVVGCSILPKPALVQVPVKDQKVAVFAGGCFWCVEADFDKVPGVINIIAGYTGGTTKNPTYKTVSAGGTGYREAVKIFYDPTQVSYDRLLYIFWRSIDPTDAGGQFCDRSVSAQAAIYTKSKKQLKIARASKRALIGSKILKAPIVTPIFSAVKFYPAEIKHQDYYRKNPIRYNFFRNRCGRDKRVKELWGNQAFAGLKRS